MKHTVWHLASVSLFVALGALGCASPDHQDQGALFGGLFGADWGGSRPALGNRAGGGRSGRAWAH